MARNRISERQLDGPIELKVPIIRVRNYAAVEDVVDRAINDFVEPYGRAAFDLQVTYDVQRDGPLNLGDTHYAYSGDAYVRLQYVGTGD